MNKKVVVFVEDLETNEVMKVELPDDFDGNMGNFLARISLDYGRNCKYYVGGLA